jgi:hypothetical protein
MASYGKDKLRKKLVQTRRQGHVLSDAKRIAGSKGSRKFHFTAGLTFTAGRNGKFRPSATPAAERN